MEKATGSRAFGVGRVLSRTFPIWFRNIVPFTILSVVVYSPLVLYAGLVRGGDRESLAQKAMFNLGSTAIPLILTGALVYGVFEQVRGQRVGILKCLRVGLTRLAPVLGLAIVVGVLVSAGMLLVIPGIIFQLMFWVAVPVAVVERLGIGASMKRSIELTSGHRGTIFGINLVLGLIMIVVIIVVVAMVAAERRPSELQAWAPMIGLLAAVPFGALFAVANAVGYHDLRVAKEGVGIEELVAVFA